MDIAGRRILITGAAGGLGSATARELARRGARLVLSGRNAAALDALATELDAEVVLADLTVEADVDRLCEHSADLDVLVLNAGVGADPSLPEVDLDAVDAVIDTNLRAPIHLAVTFAQHHLESGSPGALVLVGSLSGLSATPNTRMYNATKFGLRGFTLALGQDLAGTGITATHVAPGFIREAGMFADNDIELPKGVRTKAPQDVAAAVVKAITDGPAEVFVAPPELRISATFSTVAPALSAAVLRRLGAAERTAGR